MLTKSGAKLLDFGLAKAGGSGPGKSGVVAGSAVALASALARVSMMPTEATPLTVEGAILGTLQYMAPEQLEGREADARTDIFAFGNIVYEMITGRRAFEGKSQVGLMAAIMDQEPPSISTLQPVSPALLEHFVRTCLAKNPDARWQHAGDLLIHLKLIAEGSASMAPTPAAASIARMDGRWLAYTSDETGRPEVYVQSLPPSGGKWQISTSGGIQPKWRRDGREIYFHSASNEAMAVEITATTDGEFKPGLPRRLFSAILGSRLTERNGWDVTPDGQRFLTNSSQNQAAQTAGQISPITVVVNWLAGQTRQGQ